MVKPEACPQRPLTHLGDMPVEVFLRDYWQKRPILIRNAFASVPLVEGDELAGLSLEDEVESRILIEKPGERPLASQWQLHNGPFNEAFFAQLPESHWTLLVQAVDQLHPQIHELLHRFRFIPNWRVDDVMVSYAADGGNVGPHFDYYDVFLLQAKGQRRWRLGQSCSTASTLRTDTECKILAQFDATDEWLVQPGDLLYIPPNLAHWGVAEGECITYSIGFRAPSHSEILLDLCQEMATQLTEDQRFGDAWRSRPGHPGEIAAADIEQVRAIVQQTLADDRQVRNWFGRFMTQPQRQTLEFDSDGTDHRYRLSPHARAAYFSDAVEGTILYINGEQFPCPLNLAQQLCEYQTIDRTALSPAEAGLLQTFIDNDWVRA